MRPWIAVALSNAHARRGRAGHRWPAASPSHRLRPTRTSVRAAGRLIGRSPGVGVGGRGGRRGR